jgi:hypothetical protein
MNNNILDQEQVSQATAARPVFLSTLCVLSFAGITLQLAAYAYGILLFYSEPQSPLIPDYAFGIVLRDSLPLAGCELVMLAGVIMMWRLKRTGYYIYLAGQLLNIAVPFVFGSPFNGLQLLFSGLFMIFYGINFRSLR